MKYIGIDIGGMSIKAGVVQEDGTILCKKTIVTDATQEDVKIVKDIASLIDALLTENGIDKFLLFFVFWYAFTWLNEPFL